MELASKFWGFLSTVYLTDISLMVPFFCSKFRARMSKYGDKVLETIESTIKEHMKSKNSGSSNDSTDSVKRRRARDTSPNLEDFEFNSTGRSKKMATNRQNKVDKACNNMEQEYYGQYIDDDLDFEDYDFDINGSGMKTNQSGSGRVLPSWSTPGNVWQLWLRYLRICHERVEEWTSKWTFVPLYLYLKKRQKISIATWDSGCSKWSE